MGIRHLNKFLRQKCTNVSINKQHLSAFRNKTIVVDTSIYLYRFSSEDALIENMYLMISMFRNYDITPLFVFDGKPPAEKMELLRKRREEKYVAQQQYNMLLNTSKNIMNPDIQHELEMLRKKMLKIKTEDINRVKQLIEYYGVNHFTPPGEADDFCAYMVLSGKADCCLSDDTDLFLYNCPYVLRNLSLINHTVICNDSNKIFEELNVSFQSFRDIMILGGTDYNVLDKELEFKWKIHKSWVVSYNKNGWQDTHTHHNSIKSCVVCLLGHGDGTLEFETGDKFNMYQGDVVLFDSNIKHWAHHVELPKTILSFDVRRV